MSSAVTQPKCGIGSEHQVCHTHPAMLESWEGSSQASCPALPNLGKAEPPLWPCPCQAGNPQQHQSLCCAGHWAHLNPVQAANRFLPAFQTASHTLTLPAGTGKSFCPVYLWSSPVSALSMSMENLPLIPKPAPPGSEEGAYKAVLQWDSLSSAESRESL